MVPVPKDLNGAIGALFVPDSDEGDDPEEAHPRYQDRNRMPCPWHIERTIAEMIGA